MTSEELESLESQHDLQIIEYIKKILKILQSNSEERLTKITLEKAKQKLLYLTSKLINYQPTLTNLKSLLS